MTLKGQKESFGVITVLWESAAPILLEQRLRGAEATLRRYHMSKGKEKPQQNGRRGEIAFRIKSHTCQRHSVGSNIPSAH